MGQQTVQWVGERMLRVAFVLVTVAVFAPFLTVLIGLGMARTVIYREGVAVVSSAALVVACIAVVLFVVVGIRRGEQRRRWNDFVAGRQVTPASVPWSLAIVVTGLVAPVAGFLLIRVPAGCSVMNMFGLPWPNDVTTVVLVSCGSVALAASVLALGGLAVNTVRSASVAILWYWVAMLVPGSFLLFLSLWGDPGPATCQ
jgi:hypothetical protein